MNEKIITCPVCRGHYQFHSFYSGDQSMCPCCRKLAQEACEKNDSYDQIKRRYEFFGV